MPFKSKAQVRWGGANLSKAKFDEWAHATKNIKKLPEKVKSKAKKKKVKSVSEKKVK